jgi:hypothetical protein
MTHCKLKNANCKVQNEIQKGIAQSGKLIAQGVKGLAPAAYGFSMFYAISPCALATCDSRLLSLYILHSAIFNLQ